MEKAPPALPAPALAMEKALVETPRALIMNAPSPVRARRMSSGSDNTVPLLSAPKPDYAPCPGKTLSFCYELQKAERLVSKAKSPGNLSAAAEALTRFLKPGALTVVSRTVGQDHPFTFNSVHGGLQAPVETEQFPVVVEFVIKEGETDRMFVRVRVNLDHYDGVTATHTGFQVLEYLEHGGDMSKISPYPFTDKNGSLPGNNFGNFFRQLAKAKLNALGKSLANLWPWQGRPEKSVQADGGRQQVLRFRNIPASTKFRDILKVIDAVRKELELENLAVTVNYSPQVALAFVPGMDELQKSREEKLKWITLPPKGVGPPPAMGEQICAMMFNVVFFNNYGKHDPNISAEITDFLWDWVGFLEDMPPFTFVIQIQGRLFVRWCMPSSKFEQIEKAGLLNCLGEAEATVSAR